MTFKYQIHLDEIESKTEQRCTESYQPITKEAFRFTFNQISDNRNFQPMGEIHNGLGSSCGDWALSFNDTLDQSKSSYEYLTYNRPNKYKKLGTAIARGIINEQDGICSESNTNGHFDCHVYEDTNLETRFEIVEILREDD